jgi:cytochrome oxidase assembly protein ShyY1
VSRRVPLWPTLATFIMMTVLISLGLWQLQRRDWKHALIAELQAAETLPPLEPADYYEAMIGKRSVQYRRAELPCSPGKILPYDLKGGSSAGGEPGYLVLVSCRPNHKPPDIVAVAGWTQRPDAATVPVLVDMVFKGIIIEHPYGKAEARPQFMLIPDTAVAPLLPSRLPEPGDLPDNHLSYAFQWFGFALSLVVIYGVWLRRYLQGEKLAPAAPRL